MILVRFSRLEQGIIDALWERGAISIREIQESFPAKGRPALHDDPDHRLSPRN